MPTQINIYDLYRNINEKKNRKNYCYNEVLHKIHEKIKKVSDKELYKIFYDVPEFVYGLPTYDLNTCTAYIMKQLRANGFLVKYYFPKFLYISWDPREISNYKKEKKLFEKKKNINKVQQLNNYREVNNQDNYYHTKTPNTFSNPSSFNIQKDRNVQSNINFDNQDNLSPPTNTQHNVSIFKPIMNYDPNNIPTYNYYAYSSLNNNLVNENFYIENKSQDFNNFRNSTNQQTIDEPEHFRNLKMKNLQNKQQKEQKTIQFNNEYQKDILDYYNEDKTETEHPFKNTIKKYNSKGKFILDLS